MRIPPLLVLGLFSPLLVPVPVQAASDPIGFELYSWQKGTHWYFSVFEGTTTARSLTTIRSRAAALKGLNFVKGRLASLPTGEKVYWRQDNSRGLRLPPRETIRELSDFAEGSQIILILP